MLALTRPEGISANNVLSASVAAIREDGANADVQLRLNGALLIARITRRSLERLGLKPGTSVFALIKSVTVGGAKRAETAQPLSRGTRRSAFSYRIAFICA